MFLGTLDPDVWFFTELFEVNFKINILKLNSEKKIIFVN